MRQGFSRPRKGTAVMLLIVMVSAVSAVALGASPATANPASIGVNQVVLFPGATQLGAPDASLAISAVGVATKPTGDGYWVVSGSGEVAAYGTAHNYGGIPKQTALSRPVVGIASTPSGLGYWLVASDGGIFTFGDAGFHGSTGAMALNRPVVGIASTPSGLGYWLVASDGGVFTFGDAGFSGSLGGVKLDGPIVGMSANVAKGGYVMTTGRPFYSMQSMGTFTVTCYDWTTPTASGLPTSRDLISVDPSVIPLGTKVFIAGEGWKTAADTGVYGKWIDIWRPTNAECVSWGVRYLEVFVGL